MGNERTVRMGLVRVLTVQDPREFDAQAELLRSHYPILDITTKIIPDQPRGVYDEESEKLAEPKVVKAAVELEALGVEVIVVSCAADPGVAMARKVVGIPVVGAGTAGAVVARAYWKPVGVLTLNGEVPRPMREILGDGLLHASSWPRGVRTALDLPTEEGRRAILEAGRELKELGSEVILLGCTGMTALGVARDLSRALRLPVVDPLLSAALLATFIGGVQQGVRAGGVT